MSDKRYALISVTDKTGVAHFALQLHELGYGILSTGGTAKLLAEAGVPVTKVSDFTNSPEIMDGRVKTLHPKIHGGILMDRSNQSHLSQALELGIHQIQLVVVNLYQFAQHALSKKLELSEAIEYVDIGGPTMLRGAAKNYKNCTPVIDPDDYPNIVDQLRSSGELSINTKIELASKTFRAISEYDQAIAGYFAENLTDSHGEILGDQMTLPLQRQYNLRYGENPHQQAALYTQTGEALGLPAAKILNGKALSYNNYLDLDAAINLVADLDEYRTVAIIKHTNPCGVAASKDQPLVEIYQRALACDPKSAFGGIIATNTPIDADTAQEISKHFIECIAAPEVTPEALEIFSKKKNLRVVVVKGSPVGSGNSLNIRSINGGLLLQQTDFLDTSDPRQWSFPTKTEANEPQQNDLRFAWKICKHVKSNAIVYAKDLQTIAIGAGQVSRIDAATYSAEKAVGEGKILKGTVMASDAFFPFRDCVDIAARHGVGAIIQPGGSVRDEESVSACDEHGIAMAFTGHRHFRH